MWDESKQECQRNRRQNVNHSSQDSYQIAVHTTEQSFKCVTPFNEVLHNIFKIHARVTLRIIFGSNLLSSQSSIYEHKMAMSKNHTASRGNNQLVACASFP